MLLGVPMAHDEVQFNGARVYGPLQASHVLANWEQGGNSMTLKFFVFGACFGPFRGPVLSPFSAPFFETALQLC